MFIVFNSLWVGVFWRCCCLGLIHQLLVERKYTVKENGELKTKTTPSIVDIDSQAIDDIRKILHRYLRRTIYNFPGASIDVINQNKSTLKVVNPEEDFVGTNTQAQEIGGQRSYDIGFHSCFIDLNGADGYLCFNA